jgi:hypothetical protein
MSECMGQARPALQEIVILIRRTQRTSVTRNLHSPHQIKSGQSTDASKKVAPPLNKATRIARTNPFKKKARMPKASGPFQNLYLYSATGFAPSLKQYKCVSVAMNNAPFAATTEPFNGAENSTCPSNFFSLPSARMNNSPSSFPM